MHPAPTLVELIGVVLAGYLIGSVPFAVLIARRHGRDILKEGSGNPGATNVKRVIGKRAGNVCFALDCAKGVVAAGWPMLPLMSYSDPRVLGIAGLLAAIVGHSLSVFLKFRGGKGVATTIGGLAVLFPWVILIGLGVWLAVYFTFKVVSLASLALAASLPLAGLVFVREGDGSLFWLGWLFLAAVTLVIFARHHSNVRRLLRGEEGPWRKKKGGPGNRDHTTISRKQ